MTARPFRLTPPEPLERDVHQACADALDKLLLPPAVWFSYPAGAAQLSPQQHARYSRIGLKRGLPDIWILHNGVWCIELKRYGGRLSKTTIGRTKRGSPRLYIGQEEMFPKLIESRGVQAIAVCCSVEGMLAQLTAWHIPLRGGLRDAPSPWQDSQDHQSQHPEEHPHRDARRPTL